jgi:hypothetical protein
VYAPVIFHVYFQRPGVTPPPNTQDLRPYSTHYKIVLDQRGAFLAAPEPATLALTAGGLLALRAVARRRRA